MNNKRLEGRLKKYSDTYLPLIQLIERCETGDVFEIRLSKKEGITDSLVLDRLIFTYLKKLKINIVYIDDVEIKKIEDKPKEGKTKCEHELHKLAESDIRKAAKVKVFNKNKYPMFKIDVSSYAPCPLCYEIVEIK